MKETETHIYFWDGIYSNWSHSEFNEKIEDKEYHFDCAEQYLMASKAFVFGDDIAFKNIMATKSPMDQKAFGRGVKNFDDVIWARYARRIMYRGLYSKFSQNPELKEILLSTGNKIIVEASPVDKRWGIGVSVKDASPDNWLGCNWLGQVLMRVRKDLREGVDMRGKITDDNEYFSSEP